MARKTKVPSYVVDYESLPDSLKSVYDAKKAEHSKKNIFELREEAKKIGVESPTTLTKDQLVKRMTDRVIMQYLPNEEKGESAPPFVISQDGNRERIKGVFCDFDNEYRVGDVLIPIQVAKSEGLRSGDMVEGIATTVGNAKTLIVVNSVEGENPKASREWFGAIKTTARRDFGSMIEGTAIESVLPGLQMGERVIIRDMELDLSLELADSRPNTVGLFLGISPENLTKISGENFVVPFDTPKKRALNLATLALDRAKRLSERGKDVILVIYGFDYIDDQDLERALFGAGRTLEEGSLTVIADVSKDKDRGVYAKIATRII